MINNIDLNNFNVLQGFKISGVASGDNFGRSVSDAGDINGDGINDIIIGAYQADPNGKNNAGAAYVIYGKSNGLSDIDLTNLSLTQGFKIIGAVSGGQTGYSVSFAGDVNKDGIDDIIVGAPGVNNYAGAAYVIYGNNSTLSDIDLASFTSDQGFKISISTSYYYVGQSVSYAGDINNDGVDDIIVGEPYLGVAYVIYGKYGGLNDIDLASFNITQGFKIINERLGDNLGQFVSNAGDINEDGIDDVIVGAPYAASNNMLAGSAYVIYGRSNITNIADVSTLLPSQGFKIGGVAVYDNTGYSVSGARDVNNDGVDDVIVGAFLANTNNRTDCGAAYVVYGNSNLSEVNLANLSLSQGFTISGAMPNDRVGISVSDAGDLNKDGINDLAVGAIGAYAVYMIYGADGRSSNIDLANFTLAQGFKISGGYYAGSVDINGDNITDVIIGVPGVNKVYVLYGDMLNSTFTATPTSIMSTKPAISPTMSPTTNMDSSDASEYWFASTAMILSGIIGITLIDVF